MEPVTWPEFGNVHPYVPPSQAGGYGQIIAELEALLGAITGFDAVSLQPNSGAQGEFAGLLVIRAFHRARGERDRDVVLIPASAHGTNPASAAMAGMRSVVVACDEEGNVDLADLRAKAAEHGSRLSALMITYPSTHGVFEDAIREICGAIHEQGGQVYMDGANLNAQVGLTSPARIGADVCHLNLHKTFTGQVALAVPLTEAPFGRRRRRAAPISFPLLDSLPGRLIPACTHPRSSSTSRAATSSSAMCTAASAPLSAP